MPSPGNQADTEILALAHALIQAGQAPTICDALEILMQEAKRNRDMERQQRIKATQKAKNCRHSRQSNDKK